MLTDEDKIKAAEITEMIKDIDSETLNVIYQFVKVLKVKVLKNKQSN